MCVCVCRVFSFHHGRKQEQRVDLKKTKAKAKKKIRVFFLCTLCFRYHARLGEWIECVSLSRARAKMNRSFFFYVVGKERINRWGRLVLFALLNGSLESPVGEKSA